MSEGQQPLPRDLDWLLQVLVSLVNKTQIEIGVTLNVKGALISGELSSGKTYFEGLLQDMSMGDEASQPVRIALSKGLAQFGEVYSQPDEDSDPPVFIHLKNAKIFNTTGQAIPSNRGMWWRGRLSSVDGFSLGSLSANA